MFAIPVFLAAGSAGVVTRLNRYAKFRAAERFGLSPVLLLVSAIGVGAAAGAAGF